MFKKMLTFILLAGCLVVCAAITCFSEDGITLQDGKVVIENVWWQPLGLINATIPWKNAKVAYYFDLLHSPSQQAAGVEGYIIRQPIQAWQKVLSINLLFAAVVSGGQNKGMTGLSLDLSSTNAAITDNWHLGPWIGTLGDGSGPWGGIKAFTRF